MAIPETGKRTLFCALLLWAVVSAVSPETAAAPLADYDEQQKEQKVVMYATSWCPYCRQARNYFHQQGISYTEYDIERDADAKRRYQAFGGRGIPVIFVGKRRMNGFSVSGFNKIYQ